MDIYSTRAQLAAIDLMPRECSVLYDFFARDGGAVEDDKAIYDYRKGSRRMAPTVHPGTGGVLMDRDGFETREIGFCTIAPERVIENDNLRGRMFGEKVLGGMTPQEREKKLLARDLVDMRKAIQRRREWMVRQVLLTGKLSVFNYTNEGRGMEARILINPTARKEINRLLAGRKPDEYIFQSRQRDSVPHKPRPISRQRCYQIINHIAKQAGVEERIGCHTLRKTFGYHYYQTTGDVVSLQRILGHSFQRETLVYIGVVQENIDESMMKMNMLTGRGVPHAS